jgi:septal ring factor EnvC (AmiA/AmiB activator)
MMDALTELVDMLIKHGTMPNAPMPKQLAEAKAELAALQAKLNEKAKEISFLDSRNKKLEAVVEAAEESIYHRKPGSHRKLADAIDALQALDEA